MFGKDLGLDHGELGFKAGGSAGYGQKQHQEEKETKVFTKKGIAWMRLAHGEPHGLG